MDERRKRRKKKKEEFGKTKLMEDGRWKMG